MLVDQFIDRTFAREKTFFDEGIVAHVSMAKPTSPSLMKCCESALVKCKIPHQVGGTYLVMEGPQFSSLSESKLYRSWKADVIGMTNMPEAKLAREAEIRYCTVAMVTDFDCWHPDHDEVDVPTVVKTLTNNSKNAQNMILEIIKTFKSFNPKGDPANDCLDNAIITQPKYQTKKIKKKLKIIAGRVLKIINFMRIQGKKFRTIWFENNIVKIIDQTKLPHNFIIKNLKTVRDAINAIKTMEVRGAPLIGATAAYGLVLSIIENNDQSFLKNSSENLIDARPTAINLRWAVDRMMKKISGINDKEILNIAIQEAKSIVEEDVSFCKNIGLNGLKIIEEIHNKKKDTVNILTHCNAGWLATIDWGTATSPIYHAHQKGINVHVWVDETRPRNQGANLTSYELNEEKIPNTIITDNTGGILMQRGKIDMCIVGTDRTLSNGDVCNKIGTYLKALSAKDNNVPFYVALPSSTIDWNIKDHKQIPIEERNPEELSHVEGVDENNNIKKIRIYPEKSKSLNLAFDVTPAKLVTGLITEKGICEASEQGLRGLFK